MYFDENRHAERMRQRFEFAHLFERIMFKIVQFFSAEIIVHGECRDDKQNAVRAHRTRFRDLVFLEHEILAQYRQLTGGASLLQVFGRAHEILPVGQHGQARRAMFFIRCRNFGGIETQMWCMRRLRAAQYAFAWAGLFDFGNYGGLPGGDFVLNGRGEIARGWRGFCRSHHFGEWGLRFGRGDFLHLGGQYFFEYV